MWKKGGPKAKARLGPSRRLQVTAAGHWYIGLTIALGVAALVTSNNVLYLIESLLLSGMILSGLLSERAVGAVRVERVELPGIAGEAARDRIVLSHHGRSPAFCVQVGEWRDGRFHPLAYVARLNPGARVGVGSGQIFTDRGPHGWDGWAVATSYPFGFARKLRLLREPGERIVWPAREDAGSPATSPGPGSAQAARKLGQQPVEGEIRPLNPDDDYRDIVWTQSARGGDTLVRMRRAEQADPQVTLDLRAEPGSAFEAQVVRAARPFHLLDEASAGGGTLVLVDHDGRRVLRGKHAALRELALARALGTHKPGAVA